MAHAAQIDLRFRDAASVLPHFGVRACAGDFARERFHLFGQDWIAIQRQTQTVAMRVSRRAETRPCGVFGPVLDRAFAWLALTLASLVNARFSL